MKALQTQFNGKKLQVICQSKNTRNGFKHEAEILNENGYPIGFAKICYLNRTWERYTFESVIHKAVNGLNLASDKKENEKLKKRLCSQFDRQAQKNYCW